MCHAKKTYEACIYQFNTTNNFPNVSCKKDVRSQRDVTRKQSLFINGIDKFLNLKSEHETHIPRFVAQCDKRQNTTEQDNIGDARSIGVFGVKSSHTKRRDHAR